MVKWVKRQIGILSLAMSGVEKNALGAEGNDLSISEEKVQSHKQGTLEYALIKGEVTQEVRDLRWRMYKMLGASDKLIVTSMSVDEDGYHTLDIEEPNEVGSKMLLNKVRLDPYDDYPLELVVKNEPITMGVSTAFNENLTAYTDTQVAESLKEYDSGDEKRATLAEIDNDSYHSFLKNDLPLEVFREYRPKFEIEKYTKKLNVRNIINNQRLIEFYVSKYPDEYDRKTRLFISEIKRAMENPRGTDILDLKTVSFVSYKTVGVKDFYRYEYEVQEFDKIIEFDGNYVIKFKCNVTVNGEYLLEKYREEDLETRYKNKESKY